MNVETSLLMNDALSGSCPTGLSADWFGMEHDKRPIVARREMATRVTSRSPSGCRPPSADLNFRSPSKSGQPSYAYGRPGYHPDRRWDGVGGRSCTKARD